MDVKDLLYIVPNDVTYNELYFNLIRNGFIPFWIPEKNSFSEFITNYDDIKLILIDEQITGADLSIIQKIKFSPKTENSGIVYIASSEEKANKAKFLGADHIIIKPFKNEDILGILKEVLSKYNFYKNKYEIKLDKSVNIYPSLLLHFQKIANMLKTYRNVRVYAFELENTDKGGNSKLSEHLINQLHSYASSQIPLKGKTLIFPFSNNSFIVMIFYPDNFAKNIFLEFTMDIEKLISEELKTLSTDYSYGFSDSSVEIIENYEITIYSLLKKAFEVIWDTKNSKFSKYVNEFNGIIEKEAIWAEYQPIIDLSDNTIWGYEGLSRGPANTVWQAPEYLFEMAFKFDRIVDLETLCMKNTVEKFFYLRDAKRLFLNIHPSALE
ncbi:hypothetical protein J7L48_08760, partial [bacterium]|nr:hypothetical protein [bacterium]